MRRSQPCALLPNDRRVRDAGDVRLDTADRLVQARELHASSRWPEACAEFAAADTERQLGADDLELWGEAAQVCGRGEQAVEVLRRAFDGRVATGEIGRAMQIGFWLWQAHVINREFARAAGWAEKVQRLVPTDRPEPAEARWLLIQQARALIGRGEPAGAAELLSDVGEAASREGQPDLFAWATTLRGRALIDAGLLADGLRCLDEAMAAVIDGAVSPRTRTMLYCAAIATCHQAREVARAREWTRAMAAWLDSSPFLGGAYYGNCRIYRSRLMCLLGQWSDAVNEVRVVCDDLDGQFGQLVCGHAYYQLAEMLRLLGRPEAERAYRRAAELGEPTQPGLALLRLAQGEVDPALIGIRRALAEAQGNLQRLDLLPAAVTILLAAGDLSAARDVVAELEQLARDFDTDTVSADAAASQGAVLLADGDAAAALPLLRRASHCWAEHDAAYPVATLQVLIGKAYRALGDQDGAALELESAKAVFERLGARPDQQRVSELLQPPAPRHGLSPREVEVLRLVAVGRTNAQIAAELYLSERTVHRHISNILRKLEVQSRTAAVAAGVRNGVVNAGIM